MAISFVAGSMLNSNLVRDTDLGFNGNLLYIDYTGNEKILLDNAGAIYAIASANSLSAVTSYTSA